MRRQSFADQAQPHPLTLDFDEQSLDPEYRLSIVLNAISLKQPRIEKIDEVILTALCYPEMRDMLFPVSEREISPDKSYEGAKSAFADKIGECQEVLSTWGILHHAEDAKLYLDFESKVSDRHFDTLQHYISANPDVPAIQEASDISDWIDKNMAEIMSMSVIADSLRIDTFSGNGESSPHHFQD